MKTLIRLSNLSLLFSIVVSTLQAQIPNPGFEAWTGGEPDGWFTSNFPPAIVNVTPTNDSRTGTWAVRGEVVEFMFPVPPFLSTGSQTSDGFSVDQKFNRLNGYYRFSPVEGDQLVISAYMGIATASDTTVIGSGAIALGDVVSDYTLFSFDIEYFQSGDPNWANITIFIIDTSFVTFAHVGSAMLIDDLEISKVVGIDDSEGDLIVKDFMLKQNYPNPFNPKTTISYTVPELSFVTLKVYGVLGSELATLVNEEKPVGSYEIEFSATGGATELPSGTYFYSLQVYPAIGGAGSFVETKKMLLMK